MNRISVVIIVNVLASRAADLGSNPGRVKPTLWNGICCKYCAKHASQ